MGHTHFENLLEAKDFLEGLDKKILIPRKENPPRLQNPVNGGCITMRPLFFFPSLLLINICTHRMTEPVD